MPTILLINPNTSQATTDMMVAIAQSECPAGFTVHGATAHAGVAMITTPQQLADAEAQAMDCWHRAGGSWAGVIVACFGDPGLDALRSATTVPVVGICEAAMLEAAEQGRRFGVATTTPELAAAIQARADALGLAALYTGIRTTPGDPHVLVAEPEALHQALASVVTSCIAEDHVQAVVIGGGPLGQAAKLLAPGFSVPVIAPISSAVHRVVALVSQHEGTPA